MTEFTCRSFISAIFMCAFVAGGGATASQSHAQTVNTATLANESKSSKDVDIEANQMQVLEDEHKAIFTGKVDAKRGNVRLNSEKLIVHYIDTAKPDGSKKTEVTHLDAKGSVVIVTKGQRITGQWAKMDVKANKLVVGGDVVVRQGQTIVRGKKLHVDLNTNKSQMTGGRVKGSFLPN